MILKMFSWICEYKTLAFFFKQNFFDLVVNLSYIKLFEAQLFKLIIQNRSFFMSESTSLTWSVTLQFSIPWGFFEQ